MRWFRYLTLFFISASILATLQVFCLPESLESGKRGDGPWLEARALCHQADRLPDRDARPLYEQAYEKAQEAVVTEPGSAGAHYFLGLSSAKIARVRGGLSSFKYIHQAEQEMKKVIQLDPAFSEAGAYRVLGKIYFEKPGAVGGSNRKARQCLEQAVKLAPQNILNHLFLAQVLTAQGDYKTARSEALRVIATPSEDEPPSVHSEDPHQEAEKLLKSLPHP